MWFKKLFMKETAYTVEELERHLEWMIITSYEVIDRHREIIETCTKQLSDLKIK